MLNVTIETVATSTTNNRWEPVFGVGPTVPIVGLKQSSRGAKTAALPKT